MAARGGGARIYDRHGTLLYEFLDEKYGLQDRVKLDQVSPFVKDATVAAEDASFYSNPGINVKGLTRATLENLKPGGDFLKGTGGSSITQQLVKQIYFTSEERQQRSFTRKLREAVLAIKLTNEYDKDQILEWYLNEIPYGGVFTGIEAASQGYFGVSAKDLTLAQAAFLAGLPQSPSEYDPFAHPDAAKARQQEVLDLMAKHGQITQETADWAKLEQIQLHPKARPFLAPHFVQYVADYIKSTLGEDALLHGGLNVLTTLDLDLNNKANEVLEQSLDCELGPAVTLGDVDVKLIDMVYGYSTFANNGLMVGMPTMQSLPPGNRKLDPIPVLVVSNRNGKILMNNTQPKTEQVIKPEYAYMITDVLSNDENRQITYGRGSNLNIPGWRVATKTGTSEPYENSKAIGDTWTFGYTPNIAVGVWVGNSDNTPMVNIFSTTIAGATWHDVIVAALAGKTPVDFVKPPGIVTATVCVPSGLRAVPGSNCPTVTGTFAQDALDKQADDWWGGQKLAGPLPLDARLA